MRSILLLCLVAVASALLPVIRLSDETIRIMAENSKDKVVVGDAAISPCYDIPWNACQAKFNQQLGLDPLLDYRSGTQLFNQINDLLKMNTTELVKVCNQRTAFYQCLGSSYYPCMNLYNILNRPNVDYQNAFDYTRTYSGLEFMCNAGFEEVVTQWGCLHGIKTTNGYNNCMSNFNEMVNPSVLCQSVAQTGQCLNDAYKAGCQDMGAGFFGCENFRYTFQQSCYGLRCVVG